MDVYKLSRDRSMDIIALSKIGSQEFNPFLSPLASFKKELMAGSPDYKEMYAKENPPPITAAPSPATPPAPPAGTTAAPARPPAPTVTATAAPSGSASAKPAGSAAPAGSANPAGSARPATSARPANGGPR